MTEVIYTGRRTFKTGVGMGFITPEKLAEVIAADVTYPLVRDRVEAAISFFSVTKGVHFSIGGVYKIENVEVREDGRLEKMAFRGVWQRMIDSQFLAGWREADKSVSREKQIKSIIAKAEKNTSLEKAIGVLRYQYANVAPAYRRSFELWLLDQISKR